MNRFINFTERDLRIFVLYEFQQGGAVFDAYKRFCKSLGDDVMKYNDFDFFWHQFVQGILDLEHDRSKDRKQPELSDIPLDLMKEIVGKLEWKDRCLYRKVSKACRDVVDSEKYVSEEIDFYDRGDGLYMSIDDEEIVFDGDASLERHQTSYWKLALTDLKLLLKNHKNRFQKLSVFIQTKKLRNGLMQFLQSLKYKIHVKTLEFRSNVDYNKTKTSHGDILQSEVLSILPYLEPGYLENINLNCSKEFMTGRMSMSLGRLGKTEQWKLAKRLTANFAHNDACEFFAHFVRLELDVEFVEAVIVDQFKEVFQNSPHFEMCQLHGELQRNMEYRLEKLGMPLNDGILDVQLNEWSVVIAKI